ncbi:outer membrane porin, OprD family [Pseudomonas taetrolens]|uniref:Porin n=1 Tax=Pseudomonas taetrolens TaxID=47884 RepID=A0A0J6GJA0_PSETA|nr:OprD family porin [Pseudomonas taetrolens]KMM84766.1 porin [Pseudomonas taetrolens]SEB46655.1 outer membrane porin, OprD family [Pseudomonas taetrolens]SQF84513.1 outer membrane porin [Pseudomonas taetrolens]VEH45954.1 outer membrane porin [Pseudomonas taetrolens]
MNRSTLAVAVAIGLLAQQASAAGFIEDSKATLKLRNFYINNDNRDSGTPKNASYQEEWGQGFQLDYTSGFTQGTVGFGVDAIGLLGVRLDSGKGRHGNPTSANYGGTVFPTDSDGRAVSDFSSLGLTAKAKISQTELRYGTLMPKLPVIVSNDGRLLPQTFEGGQITSNEFKDLTFVGGQIEHAKGRNSSNTEGLSIAGANNARTGEFSNKFLYGGVDYKLNKDLLLQYYYGNLEDFYKQHFLGLTHNWSIGPGVLKSDVRYFNSSDDGKNGSDPAYFTTGDYRSNATGKGKVDNNLYSALFLYTVEGHTFGGGYQVSNGSSDFPWLNQGDGSSAYLTTDMQISKFARAGERTWQARYSYDFAKVGVPGLTAGAVYLRGDNIDTISGGKVATNGGSEWERDLTLAYVVQDGALKNLGVMWKNAMWRNDIAGQRDQDENRLIVSYSIPLL